MPSKKKQKKPRPRRPLIEVINLESQFTGGGGASAVNPNHALTLPFVYVARLVVVHTWDGTTLNYDLWGDAAELNFGLQILVDDRPLLPEPITNMKGYMKYAFDTHVVVDTFGLSKKVYFASRFSFNKFMGGIDGVAEGIRKQEYNIVVNCPDGLDVGTMDSRWTFEGWTWDR